MKSWFTLFFLLNSYTISSSFLLFFISFLFTYMHSTSLLNYMGPWIWIYL